MSIQDITNRIAKEAVRIELLDQLGNEEDRTESINTLCSACVELVTLLGRTPRSQKIRKMVEMRLDSSEQFLMRNLQPGGNHADVSFYAGRANALKDILNDIDLME